MKKLILFLLVTSSIFSYSLPPISVGIIGTAVNGWEVDVDMTTTDGINFTLANYALQNGELKFRENDDWTVNWGSTDFPSGSGIQNGDNIPITAGKYDISFNKETGAYAFIVKPECICLAVYMPVCVNGVIYGNSCEAQCAGHTEWSEGSCTTIKLHGSSLEGAVKLNRGGIGMLYDPDLYAATISVDTGEFYFEVTDWDAVSHYAALDFPNGTAKLDYDTKIPVKEGTFIVTYNSKTNVYYFTPEYYVSIGGVDLKQVDKSGNYEARNITFESDTALQGYENYYGNDVLWTKYGNGFPSGELTDEAITMVAVYIPKGTYDIFYSTKTKKYSFEEPSLSTTNFNRTAFTVWPNPVNSDIINISEELSFVQLFDIHGRLLFSKKQTQQLDVTGLDAGTYFLTSGNKTIKISIQ